MAHSVYRARLPTSIGDDEIGAVRRVTRRKPRFVGVFSDDKERFRSPRHFRTLLRSHEENR
jgi:hypothetical protein